MKVYGYAQIWISTNIDIDIPEDKINDEDYIVDKLYEQFKKEGIDISEIDNLYYEFE